MGTVALSEFTTQLDRDGELVRVKTRVSPILEIAATCDRQRETGMWVIVWFHKSLTSRFHAHSRHLTGFGRRAPPVSRSSIDALSSAAAICSALPVPIPTQAPMTCGRSSCMKRSTGSS
jgi:hypothetical protein